MLLSVPLWAIIVTQMCSNWSYYTLLTSLPTYMNKIMHFDLKSVSSDLCSLSNTTLFPDVVVQLTELLTELMCLS